ncbi:Eisosome component PIL1-domain-containing protein, partial [Mycotypha africana]|uniref:Eisosome component PIL1-domain-containing protein n=1 Tax=Mycotypha africana TaxID=64632 RepID=UPI002300B656
SQSISQLAEQNRVSASHLRTFGSVLGQNFSDVTYGVGELLGQWSNILMEWAHTMDLYRDTLKTIQRKEAALQPARDQKRKLMDQIDRMQTSLSSSSREKQAHLQEQLSRLQSFTQPDEDELVAFRTMATKEALYLLLNGMHAMARKTDIVSVFGKYIVDELKDGCSTAAAAAAAANQEQYPKRKTKRIVEDALNAIDVWTPDQSNLRRTLTSHHQGRNPLLAAVDKQLPAIPTSSSENDTVIENTTPDDIPLQPSSSSSSTSSSSASTNTATAADAAHAENTCPPTDAYPLFTSTFTNHHPPQQQQLYQFYQHYLPPRSYEDFIQNNNSPAVFHHQLHDVGGFVLPFTNPNF